MKINGEKIYKIAIDMVDKHSKRFCEMLDLDSKVAILERKYFGDFIDEIELCGWNKFKSIMEGEKQGKWLRKIERLDLDFLINHLENKLSNTSDGKEIDNCGKALGALVSSKKLTENQFDDMDDEITVVFLDSRETPKEIE